MKRFKLSHILFLTFALAAFVYVALRSYFLQITHDEAWSFRLVDIFYLNAMGGLANTHWLNSFFIKIWSIAIGNDPWMLRIHSVLSFILYSYFLFRFYKKLNFISSKILLISFFIVNLFALEYFSLARGYGLTLAFFLGAIFYAYKFVFENDFEIKYFNKSLILGAISIAANYASFFHYSALITIMLLFVIINEKSLKVVFTRKYFFGISIYFSVSLITIINLILIDIYGNDLRFGADNSFIFETLASIFVNAFYIQEFYPYQAHCLKPFYPIAVILFSIIIISSIWALIAKNQKLIFFSILFFIPYFLNHLVYYLFDKPFPIGRTALILIPAIFFIIIFVFESLKFERIKIMLSLFLIISSSVLVFSRANLKYSFAWKHQSEMKKVLNFMLNQKDIENSNIAMGMYSYAIYYHYYNHINPDKYNFNVLSVKELHHYGKNDSAKILNYDYLIVGENSDLHKSIPENIKLLKVFDLSQIYVYKVQP